LAGYLSEIIKSMISELTAKSRSSLTMGWSLVRCSRARSNAGVRSFGNRIDGGYIYRGETKHFNYLANYPLPVILVICDSESREAYWVRFRAVDSQITDAGWKLTIPYGNRLASSMGTLQELLPTLGDHFSEMKEYWRVNNMLFAVGAIIFMIDIKEVAAKDISRAADFWRRLCSTKELAAHCKGKVEIGFYGYG
jgi:hypothetical protein